jgi:hypothetical protein
MITLFFNRCSQSYLSTLTIFKIRFIFLTLYFIIRIVSFLIIWYYTNNTFLFRCYLVIQIIHIIYLFFRETFTFQNQSLSNKTLTFLFITCQNSSFFLLIMIQKSEELQAQLFYFLSLSNTRTLHTNLFLKTFFVNWFSRRIPCWIRWFYLNNIITSHSSHYISFTSQI